MDQGSFGSKQQSAYTAVPMVMQSSFEQQPVYHSYMHGAQQIQNVYSPNHTPRSDVYQHHAQLQSVAPQTASPQGLMFLSNIPPPFTQVPPRGQAIYYPPTPPQQYMSAAQQPDTAYLPASLPPLIPHHPHENLSMPPSSVAAQWSVAASPPSPYRLPVTPRSSPLPISFTPTVIPSRLKLLAEHYAVSKNEKSNTSSDMSMKSSSQHGIKVRNSVTATTADSTKSVISPSSGPNFPKLLSADRGIDIKNSEDENSKSDIQNLVDYYVNKHVGLSHPKVVDNGQVKQMDKSETEASSKDNLNNNNSAAESDTSDLKKVLQFPYKLEENSNVSSNVMKKNSDVLNWLSKSESEPGEGYPDTLVEELGNESVLKEVNGDVTLATEEQERRHCPKLDVRKNSVDSLKSEVALVNEYVATNDNYAGKKINNFFEAGSDVVIEEHELLLQNMTDDFSEYSQDNILIEDNGGIRSDTVHESKENVLHVKKGKDESDDFEKFFFKVTASRHGISISSPEKERDLDNGEVPNSSQSLKTVNDISSVEGSQSDVGDAFKLKASQSGIIVQDPKERAEFSTDSDAELDQSYRDRANLQRKRHLSTPVPSNIKLDPKIPEFKPRSRKRAVSCGLRAEAISEVDHKKEIDSTIRADAPAFVPIWKTTDPKKNNDIIPSEQKEQKQESTAQIDSTPLSKESASNTTVAIQAQPDTSDVNVETVKIVTKESSTVTCTCECRDVSVNTVTDAEINGENEVVKRSSRRFSSKATNTDMSNKRTIGTQHSTKEKVKPQMNDQDTMTELLPELGEGCGGPCLDVLGAAQILQKQAVLMKSIGQIQNEMKQTEVTEGKFQIKDSLLKFVLDVIGLFTEEIEPCKLKNEIERKLQAFVDESLIHAKSVSVDTVSSSQPGDIGEGLPDVSSHLPGIHETEIGIHNCTSLDSQDIGSASRTSPETQNVSDVSRTSPEKQNISSVSRINPETQDINGISTTSPEIVDSSRAFGTSSDTKDISIVSRSSPEAQDINSVSRTGSEMPDISGVSKTSPEMQDVSEISRSSPDTKDVSSAAKTSPDTQYISSVSKTSTDKQGISRISSTSQSIPMSEKKTPKEVGFMEIEDDTDEDDDVNATVISIDKVEDVTVNSMNKETEDKQILKEETSRGFNEPEDSAEDDVNDDGRYIPTLEVYESEESCAEILNEEHDEVTLKFTPETRKPVNEMKLEIPAISENCEDMAKANKEIQIDELGDRGKGKLNPSLEKTLFDKKVEEFLEYSIKEVGDNKSNVKFETSKEVGDNKSNVKFETSKDDLPDVDTNSEDVIKHNNTSDENCAMIKMISEKMSAEYGLKPDNKGDASNIVDNTKEDSGDIKESSTVTPSVSIESSKSEMNLSQAEVFKSPPGLGGPDSCLYSKVIEKKSTNEPVVGMQNEQVVSFTPPVAGIPFIHPFIDPGIYQAVEAQLKMLYPEIASNPAILTQVAIQQTCILQMCLNSQTGDVNQAHGNVNQVERGTDLCSLPDDQPLRLPGKPTLHEQGGLPTQSSDVQKGQTIPTLDKQLRQPISQSDMQKGQSIPTLDRQLKQPISQTDLQKGPPISTLDKQLRQPISQSDLQKGPPISTLDKQLRQPISQSVAQKGQSIPTLDKQLRQPISQSDVQKVQPISTLDKQLRQPISQSDVHKNQPIPTSDWQGRQTFPPSATKRTPISSMDRQGEQELPPSDRQRKQISGKYIQEPHNYPTVSNESWDDEVDDNAPGFTLHDIPQPKVMVTRESKQASTNLSATAREVPPVISKSSVTDLCEISLNDRLKFTTDKTNTADGWQETRQYSGPADHEGRLVKRPKFDKHGGQLISSSDTRGKPPIPPSGTLGKPPIPPSGTLGKPPIPPSGTQGKSDRKGRQLIPTSDTRERQPIIPLNTQGRQTIPSADRQGKQATSSDRMRQVTPSFHQEPQNYPRVSNESWDDEVDDYAPTFTLYHDVHKPITMGTRENKQAQFNNLLSAPVREVPPVISSSSLTDLCEIPLGNATKTLAEKVETAEEWQEVQTKRKRHCSKEQQKDQNKTPASLTNPTSSTGFKKEKQQKHSNFERLVGRMQEEFQQASRQEIIDAIQKIRKEQGTLSGMSMELILEKAEGFLKPGKKKIPGLVYEKKKPNTLPPRMQQQQLQQQQQHISQKQQATKKPVSLLELKLPPRKSASIGFLKMDIPPRMKYNGALETCLNTYEEDMCVICHDPLSSEVVKELDCKHVFHAECIGQWVEKERTCPTCRQHALFPEEFPRLGK